MPQAASLIVCPGTTFAIWTPRDDRPGWVATALETYAGQWSPAEGRKKLGSEFGCMLRSPFGYGLLLLTPTEMHPSPTLIEARAGTDNALIAPLGSWLTFWCKPDPARKWFTRTVMVNANCAGFFLTAGQGGRGKRGKVRLASMGTQTPPETAIPVESLIQK